MRGLTVGLVVLFLLFAHAAAAEENRQADYQAFVSGTIQVTKEGTVSAYALKEEVKPAVRTLLDKNIRSWRFEPILVDGYPVVATTSMALRLVAVPMANKQYALSIAEARFGDPDQSDTVVPPPYPPDALRAAREAEVMLILQLDPQGRVLNVHAEQTSLNIPPDYRTAAYWRDRFEKTSIQAARLWKFDITEKIDGRPLGGSVRVPVKYALHAWSKYIPGPVSPAPWISIGIGRVDSLPRREGQAQSLDSRFKPMTEIVGEVL